MLAVFGAGRVAGGLLAHLSTSCETFVIARRETQAEAAILDAASVTPELLALARPATPDAASRCDLVVLAAGTPVTPDTTADSTLAANQALVAAQLDSFRLKRTAIVIVVGSPVDQLTPFVQRRAGLPRRQVLGFGGDLDRNRVIAILGQRGLPTRDAAAVGEHGARCIPVYADEEDWPAVATTLRTYLSTIVQKGGTPQNLASGRLLARLVDDLLAGGVTEHTLCAWHPGYNRTLTWPVAVCMEGSLEPTPLDLGPRAAAALRDLPPMAEQG